MHSIRKLYDRKKLRGNGGIMNRKAIFLLIGLFLLTVCSCGTEKDKDVEEWEDPFYFGHGTTVNICSDENYYYTAVSGRVAAASKDSLDFQIICNRPDCFHDDDTCTAYLNMGGVWNAGGQMYVLKTNYNRDAKLTDLIRISVEDGVSTKIATLMQKRLDESGSSVVGLNEFMIHKGYAYYVIDSGANSGEEKTTVYRVRLKENAEPEALFEVEARIAGCKLIGKGDRVYILALKGGKSGTLSTIMAELYEYSVSDGTLNRINCVGEVNANSFYIHGGDFIYETLTGKEIRCISLETGKERLIAATQTNLSGGIYANDSYIFDWRFARIDETGEIGADEAYTVWIYTYEGELAAKIDLPTQDESFFAGYPLGADERHMFLYRATGGAGDEEENSKIIHHIWTYDLTDLEGGVWEDHIIE